MKTKTPIFKICCEDGGDETCVHKSESQEAATRWLDLVLEKATRGRFSLLSELNGLQSDDEGNTVFASKFSMPLKIVNLAIQPYGFYIKTAVV